MNEEKTIHNRGAATKMLTESALFVALAIVLSLFKMAQWPYGGSITLGSMIPIALISLKYRFGWSLLTAMAYSLIQMMLGFYAPPVENLLYYSLMILLDYVVAFSVLSLSGPIYRKLNQGLPVRLRLMTSMLICFVLRFFCHFASGIIIWGTYAPEGQPVWLYSLVYNGPYMLGECIIGAVILLIAGKTIINLFMGSK